MCSYFNIIVNCKQLVVNCKQLVIDVRKLLFDSVANIVIFGQSLDILFAVGRKGPVDFVLVVNCELLVNLFATNRHTTVVLVVVNRLLLLDWVVGDSNVVGSCRLKYHIGSAASDAKSLSIKLPKNGPH